LVYPNSGGVTGIYSKNAATIVNNGSIFANDSGTDGPGGDGIVLVDGGTIINTGLVLSGFGGTLGGPAGTAIVITNAYLNNSGRILGEAPLSGNASESGIGIIATGSTIINSSEIIALNYVVNTGTPMPDSGGPALLLTNSFLDNSFIINGGATRQGTGGAGVSATGGTIINSDIIDGGKSTGPGAGGAAISDIGGTIQNAGVLRAGYGATGGAGVSLSGGAFTNTSTGQIYAGTGKTLSGGAGIVLSGKGSVLNEGVVFGGFSYEQGGAGVALESGSLTNAAGASIIGGQSGVNGQGGAGASITSGATLLNQGTIRGGELYSGAGLPASGTRGAGDGVYLGADSGSLINDGTIIGGAGYAASLISGGAGIVLNGVTFTNNGGISGGAESILGAYGDGGYGAGLTNATLINDGTITGGIGGGAGKPGTAGVGVTIVSGLLRNEALIAGGTDGKFLAVPGLAAVIGAGTLVNTGTLAGAEVALLNAAGGMFENDGRLSFAIIAVSISAAGTFVNSTYVYGSQEAVRLSNTGGLIENSGTINGGTYALLALGTAWITNTGLIEVSGTGIAAVDLQNGAVLTNSLTGEIEPAGDAATLAGGTLINEGNMGSAALSAGALLVNRGTIGGQQGPAGRQHQQGGAGGSAVMLAASTFNNSGLILGGQGGRGGDGSYNIGYSGQGGQGGTGGAAVFASSGSLTNSGTIIGGEGGEGGLTQYGVLGNGGNGGVGISIAGSATLQNSGTIFGGHAGYLFSPAPVLTTGSGIAYGGSAVVLSGGALINAGLLEAGADTAIGGYGYRAAAVQLDGGTLTNAGRIAGVASAGSALGDAVLFGTAAARLIIESGATFTGAVAADATVSDVLELASGGGMLDMGTSFSGFSTLQFDTGDWRLEGGSIALADGESITGLAYGDMLVLDGFLAGSKQFISGTGLELTNGSVVDTLAIDGDFSTTSFSITTGGGNTTISLEPTAPCFAAGTRIRTASGAPRRVEALAVGDEIALFSGATAPVIWIGRRTLDLRRHPRPEAVQPVLITAGALADGLPCRDLLVSPDHAVYLDGHLIPAKALLNGFSIRQLTRKQIAYYHIELAAHAVLFAEDAPAESYLETGNRAAFENSGPATVLHPDFAQTLRETKGCAPFAESGPVVEAVRQRILDRAGIEMTDDPEMQIRYEKAAAIIASRAAIPGEIFADPRDRRRLGVKIANLQVDGHDIPLDHPALTEGWHNQEPDGRWTNGNAEIPIGLSGGSKNLKISLAATLRYPLRTMDGVRRADRTS